MVRRSKSRYSEAEAARKLQVPVEELRAMVRRVLVTDPDALPVTEFRPTDLVLLQVLSLQQATGTFA
jgi:hypothetical protein